MNTTIEQPTQLANVQGVQPGGHGIFVRIELALGALRRGLLRTFRPGYVRMMRERRRGTGAGIPHEVIDERDLRYYRNVTDTYFDPPGKRWQVGSLFGFARYGVAELIGFTALFALAITAVSVLAALVHPYFGWLALPLGVLWLEIPWFFRDPERTPPTDANALISPADGTVTNVEEVDDADFPNGRALRVSIFLSVFNVHVNRMPRTDTITALKYVPGHYYDARNPDAARLNEQLWIDMREPNGRAIRIKQISGAIARRIVCWLKPGDEIPAGERVGMIKFGSRTDILVPADGTAMPAVKVGDKVQGGLTVVLRFRETA